ncbi:MAG: ABC transporter ATP-binding protein [Planctomycetes bacterium]|jgi:ABC-type glutathione transport system ATPase component|nr:ABC transporter ATP-binding protein [Planctomycetota bacterium]MBT7012694.1 ABC transporter ATP-binding protein [Planctomycetota bacterium]
MELPLLTVENLCVRDAALAELPCLLEMPGFSIEPGEAVALVGPSGSGKSLTALSLLGLLPTSLQISAGASVQWKGQELLGLSEKSWLPFRGGQVAMVFQDPSTALNPVLTVGFQLLEVLSLHCPDLDASSRVTRACDVLTEVGLKQASAMMQRYSFELSGGQRQRVMLALALAGEPSLLIADEPTTALDPVLKAKIMSLVQSIRTKRGLALLWISHDLPLVQNLCDRVIRLAAPGERVLEPSVAIDLPSRRPVSESAPVVLEVKGLRVEYPTRRNWFGQTRDWAAAVDDVSFQIRAGEVLALVGESGSGKSTIGRAVMGLLPQATGQVWLKPSDALGFPILGEKSATLRPLRRHFAMVFQDPAASLDPRMPVWKSIAEPLEIHTALGAVELRVAVNDLLKQVGLSSIQGDSLPSELSGGQCQRVALARALALKPSLLVCDEALSALDAPLRQQHLALLAQLQEETGCACLFITHDLASVAHLAHRVGVLQDGVLVELGPCSEVLNQPLHSQTRALLAADLG